MIYNDIRGLENMNSPKKLLAYVSIIGILAIPFSAYTTARNFSAYVYLVAPLSVTQNTELDFGVIEASDSTVTITVAADDGAQSGTATVLDSGSISQGVFTIEGSAHQSIGVGVTDGGSVAGFEFTAFTGTYNGSAEVTLNGTPLGPVAAPGAGKTLEVGGTLSIANTVTEGTYAPDFTIEVVYQ